MKILILFSFALAVAHATYYPSTYYNVPAAIGPHGSPIETPEVQVAKAAHFAAHAQARYGHPVVAHYGALNALPLDTPEVAAAKLQHYQDYAVAAQRNGVHVHGIALGHQGYPLDTPEVQVAKAAHFAAHARALGGHVRRRRAAPYPLHYPVLDHAGVPVETPEVQAAKAHHYAEFARIASRPGQNIPDSVDYNSQGYYSQGPAAQAYSAQAPAAQGYSAPAAQEYSSPYYAQIRGPGGPPAEIGHDGQPRETYEVQAAKAAHFAAHQAVRAGNYGHFAY